MSTQPAADQQRAIEHAGPGRDPGLRPLAALLVAVAAGLVLGMLTAYGQGWLPHSVGSLANSAGSWSLAAFLLGLLAPGRISGVLCGFATLAGLLVGYVVTDELRGYAATGLLVFWGVASVVAGPMLGLGAQWLRRSRRSLAALGAGAMSGVLVGEGVYGLLYVADTTYPPYWWGEIVAGAILLGIAVGWRLRGWSAAWGALITTVVAAAFVVVYQANGAVITLL